MADPIDTESSNLPIITRGLPGTISGFDSITLADGTLISEANFSVEQLRQLYSSLQSELFLKQVRFLGQQMQRHAADTKNPHRVTMAELDDGDLGAILKRYVPGTTPRAFPIVAVQAMYESGPQILSSIAVSRNGPINVIDRQGFLAYYDENTSAVDWSLGYPTIPCWPYKDQYVADTTMLSNTTVTTIGCEKDASPQDGSIPNMSTDQIVLTETGGQTQVKCTISTKPLAPEITASIMLYPTKSVGTYYIASSLGSVLVDANTKTVVFTDTGIVGHLHVYPNGWCRIGMQVIPKTSAQSFVYDVGYTPRIYDGTLPVDDAFKTYVSSGGSIAFAAFGPQVTSGPGMAPFTKSSSIAATTLSIPGFPGALPTAAGIVALSMSQFPSLTGSTETLLSMDNGLKIACTSNAMTESRTIDATLPITTTPVDITTSGEYSTVSDEVDYAMSYSLSGLAARMSNAADRTSISGRAQYFTAMAKATTMTVGSFNGGITSVSLYAFPDDNRTLEFIIGEDQ